jgi:hypothetical protein
MATSQNTTTDETTADEHLAALQRLFNREDKEDVSQKDPEIYGPATFKVDTPILSESDRTALSAFGYNLKNVHAHTRPDPDADDGEDPVEAYVSAEVVAKEADR